MKTVNIGVDVGNYDTKTSHRTIPSGYRKYASKPEIATKILCYKGAYYVPEISERKPYVVDKTQDDQCLVLTLFGIAEELLYMAKESSKSGKLQEEIDKFDHIKLGVGLPPGHFNAYSAKTLEYYKEQFSGKVSFSYKNYDFSFEVDTIRLFPQDFVAVYKNQNCQTAKKKRYYIVGIGGGTTDVIPVLEGQPDVNNCVSLQLGTRVMYRQICADVQRQYGEMLDESLVEDVLRGEDTILPDEYIELIKEGAKQHFDNIINGCIQQGVKLSLYPVVFYGGGCLLLKDEICENKKLKDPEILGDVNANAKAYAMCLGA
ncbi:MAG: ParM/StbA family protein [Treponema sp.]|nr:ParM/StbA family protein [Treponema sp.]